MNRKLLRNFTLLIGGSLIIACAAHTFNLWAFSLHRRFSPADASFIEGILLIINGVLFLLGSGGITSGSLKAALLSAVAQAIYGKETIGPSEIYERDAWKEKGHARLGLTFIFTGIILLAIYLVSTYTRL